MEFNRLLSQAISFYGDDKKNYETQSTKNNKFSKVNTDLYKNILNEKDLDNLVKKLNEKSIISIDTETTSLDPMVADLVGISFACGDNEAYYIPISHKKVENLNKDIVIKKIKKIFEDPSIKKVGQNIKYDLIILKKYGLEIKPIEDTMLISYALDAGNNRHNMDTLSELHLGHKTISFKEVVGTEKTIKFFRCRFKSSNKICWRRC